MTERLPGTTAPLLIDAVPPRSATIFVNQIIKPLPEYGKRSLVYVAAQSRGHSTEAVF